MKIEIDINIDELVEKIVAKMPAIATPAAEPEEDLLGGGEKTKLTLIQVQDGVKEAVANSKENHAKIKELLKKHKVAKVGDLKADDYDAFHEAVGKLPKK